MEEDGGGDAPIDGPGEFARDDDTDSGGGGDGRAVPEVVRPRREVMYVAFPEDRCRQAGVSDKDAVRVKIDGQLCLAVLHARLADTCWKLQVGVDDVSLLESGFEGILFAQLPGTPGAVRRTAATAPRPAAAPKAQADPVLSAREELRKRYMALCGAAGRQSTIKIVREAMTRLEAQASAKQQELIVLLRQIDEKRREISVAEGAGHDPLSRFGEEFEKLLTNPDISALKVEGRQISFDTVPIEIEHGSAVYDIGAFTVRIEVDTARVTMHNKTRRMNELHHPHVDRGGNPCLGNIKEIVPELVAQHRYPALIAVCVEYLRSYADDDGFRPFSGIANWPRK